VQFFVQRVFDIQPTVSVQTRSLMTEQALRVQPWQKGGCFARRRGSEYAQFDGQMYGLGLPFPTKLVCDLECAPHMVSFLRHHSLNFENRESDEV
jgi:hypothetical protein